MKSIRAKQGGSLALLLVIPVLLFSFACSPVGSEGWCEKMKETPKGDWSTNDAKEFAKNCVFK